jgi:hypothetical protein
MATQAPETLLMITAVSLAAMENSINLSLGQRFEVERLSRAIDAEKDLQVLRGLAKQLLEAWHTQRAATSWVVRQQLGLPAPAQLQFDP